MFSKNVTCKWNTSKYPLVRDVKNRDFIKLCFSINLEDQELIDKLHNFAPNDAKSCDYFTCEDSILVRYFTDYSGKYQLNLKLMIKEKK